MSTYYLQKKVKQGASGYRNKYIIMDSSEELLAVEFPASSYPTINIIYTLPTGITITNKQCMHNHLGVTVTGSGPWACNPSTFGLWEVIFTLSDGNILRDTVLIQQIQEYTVNFNLISNYPGYYSGEISSGEGES